MFQLDIMSLIPNSLKQTARDVLVDFVADQAKKYASDELATKIKKLRSDAAFNKTFDEGLQQAAQRFVEEYKVEDEDLVVAIAADKEFFENKEIQQALLAVLKKPSAYLDDERDTLFQSFDTVLPQRLNRERVNRAVTYLLRCLAEELWHMPELQPVYSLQFQRVTAEATREQVAIQKAQLQALTGLNAGIREALLQLTDAIAEKKALPAGDQLALPAPPKPKVYHNLPQPDYGRFVGRDKELVQVARILRPYPHSQEHLVTIDGIGGIGKSALALEVAHRFLRNYDRIPPEERFEAIIWTSAKQNVLTAEGITTRRQVLRTLDDIYTAIAVALQREDITRARPEEQAEVVRQALTQQRTLLIVDNLETVDDEMVLSFLRELPAPTKAVITTRHRLDVAYPVRLVGMPWDDAQQLIAQEQQKKSVILSQDEVHRLYDRTGGVPLAIVWSIAQMGFGYGVEAMLTRLGQQTSDIARFCFEGTVERIRGKPAHKLLMVLSLFATDASREALGYVANLPELDRDEGLVELERLSLINKASNRFWLLPLTKAFASEENAERKKRYIQFYLEFCQREIGTKYWDSTKYDAKQMMPEMENLILAINLGFSFQNWQAVQGIFVGIVHPLASSLATLSKRVDLAEKAIIAAKNLEDKEMLAWFHIGGLAYALEEIGQMDEALDHTRIGQSIAQEAGLSDCLAYVNYRLASLAMKHRDYDAALRHIQLALSEAVSPETKLRALMVQAQFYENRGDLEKALETYLTAAEIASEGGVSVNEVWALQKLGNIYRQLGELDAAEKSYLRVQMLANNYGWSKNLADSTLGLAQVSHMRDDWQLARNYAKQAKAIYEQIGRIDRVEEIDKLLKKLAS